jgi:hypothetical protein
MFVLIPWGILYLQLKFANRWHLDVSVTERISRRSYVSTGPPVWSSGQRSRVWFPALPDFLRSSGSGTGSTQLVSRMEEVLGRNNSGSGVEIRECGLGDPLRWPRDTLYPQKLAQTSLTSVCLSVGIVRSRTKASWSPSIMLSSASLSLPSFRPKYSPQSMFSLLQNKVQFCVVFQLHLESVWNNL